MFQIFKKEKTRHLILHYHLFKNAGSTFDSILRTNFKSRWGSIEGDPLTRTVTNEKITEYILANPKLVAVSSHEARPPAPVVSGVKIYSVVFLRHPIDRIGSIYSYRRALPHIKTKSTQVAKEANMAEFIRWCLANPSEETVVNFHTIYLSKIALDVFAPPSLEVALQTLRGITFLGIVELFDDSLIYFRKNLAKSFGKLKINYKVKNKSSNRMPTIEDRLKNIQSALGRDLYQEVLERNAIDLELYRIAYEMFNKIKQV